MGAPGIPAIEIGGVRIDSASMEQAVHALLESATLGQGAAVHLCNAYTVSLASRDSSFRDLLNRGSFNFPDGMPLVWATRRLGIPLKERVYGPDLMLETFDKGRNHAVRHFLYGSTDDVLAELRSTLELRFPGAAIVGQLSPPFRELTTEDDADVGRAVRASEATIVWVGLGTPKQDYCVDRLAEQLGVPCVAVGAAFNFHAGRVRQAPPILQRVGLEWAFRLATEPRRLWRRYLVGNTVFMWSLLRSKPKRLGPRA